jgi:trans-aconitate methyltransferase
VRRCLNPGGKIRFNFAADGNCSNFNRIVKAVMAMEPYAPFFCAFEWPWNMPVISDYEKLLKNSCFTETRVWGENADRYFPDASAMAGWIEQPSLVPFLAVVEEKDRAGFKEAVVKRMIEATAQKDGTCFETFRRINVYAVK